MQFDDGMVKLMKQLYICSTKTKKGRDPCNDAQRECGENEIIGQNLRVSYVIGII